jgi:hypothetical protein
MPCGRRRELGQPKTEADEKPSRRATSVFAPARVSAVLALGRAGRNVGQRDSGWSFCVRWRMVSRAAVSGSGLPQSCGRARAAVKTMAIP